jgi:hypothetical protein
MRSLSLRLMKSVATNSTMMRYNGNVVVALRHRCGFWFTVIIKTNGQQEEII